MNEWLKKIVEQIKTAWGKWKLVQKLAVIGIGVALIAAIIITIAVSRTPTMVRLINTPIKSDEELRLITNALDREGIPFQVGENNIIYVKDEKTRSKANAILLREDLIPKGTDPWAVFSIDRFTVTDFERNVNLRKAIIAQVTRHIESLDDVDKANVIIEIPEDKLFSEDQKPVTASVIIYPKPGSDIATNRKKLEGIQKIIKFAVSGLTDENIVITDNNGIVLNDFAGMADFDRLELTKREQQIIQRLEAEYRAKILNALQLAYTKDRVRDLNIKIEMDMSKKAVQTEEYFPFVLKPDNPLTPYDDSDVRPSVRLSTEKTTYEYQGTGFNPEGPAGMEGQTAPAYKDLQNMVGTAKQEHTLENEALNKRNITEERSPQIDRVSVSVNIDGRWVYKTNEKGEYITKPDGTIEREYIPLTQKELDDVTALIQGAIAFDRARGDLVVVKNVPFDRTEEFRAEDAKILAQKQREKIIFLSLAGLAVLLLSFIIYRIIAREIERKRRILEEKRALEQQMLRENALRQAEEQNLEVSMSVEERKRLDLQEHAINMAKEHPEDVAQLIRTWLRED
ncbi:MAG TPA: flagellar basal-body MS-ring/collar protein FliF [Spirochaetia bacterium]|nr:flagellar basal-body MS-ring/collar protein FliF [Spirochaetales bacterium]HRS65101.1 flagellar basal-body MS-ring/collar protein FliF [Spirochaetia bacterium]HOT59835.1 flagellar basal-body MS-ring/collar protein FliF [Spirochaetales bacterium]HPD79698.1 flagellar basal-body MS-ring/collar protein FliF [Spirochaetales bacterium]HQK33326.1 flagellar basal-body MS-ring/collar protein FliF [Spirochaetales bacterium]